MFVRIKKNGAHEYLQLVSSERIDGKVRQRVIGHAGPTRSAGEFGRPRRAGCVAGQVHPSRRGAGRSPRRQTEVLFHRQPRPGPGLRAAVGAARTADGAGRGAARPQVFVRGRAGRFPDGVASDHGLRRAQRPGGGKWRQQQIIRRGRAGPSAPLPRHGLAGRGTGQVRTTRCHALSPRCTKDTSKRRCSPADAICSPACRWRSSIRPVCTSRAREARASAGAGSTRTIARTSSRWWWGWCSAPKAGRSAARCGRGTPRMSKHCCRCEAAAEAVRDRAGVRGVDRG